MALPARFKRTGLPAQFDQIVHKARRNAEMARSLAVTMSLIDIRNNTPTQLKRQRLAHRGLLSTAMNHELKSTGILNPLNRDGL
jgi:hypothetical protein